MTKQQRETRNEEIYKSFEYQSLHDWILYGHANVVKRLSRKYRLTPRGVKIIRRKMIKQERLMRVLSGDRMPEL
jgi:hypothetical protein